MTDNNDRNSYDWSVYDAIYMAKIETLEQEKYEKRYVAPMFFMDLFDDDCMFSLA